MEGLVPPHSFGLPQTCYDTELCGRVASASTRFPRACFANTQQHWIFKPTRKALEKWRHHGTI